VLIRTWQTGSVPATVATYLRLQPVKAVVAPADIFHFAQSIEFSRDGRSSRGGRRRSADLEAAPGEPRHVRCPGGT
jgi:hypothetical protein